MRPTPDRNRRLAGATARITVTVILLTGMPYTLARFIGWPLPAHLLTWTRLRNFLITPLGDDAIIKVLACVVWLLWVIFALSVTIEVIAAVWGHPAPRLPVIGPVQAFAAALVGTTMLTAIPLPQASPRTFPLQRVLPSAAATASPRPGQPARPATSVPHAAILDARTAKNDAVSQTVTPRPPVHRVRKGDNLWDLATRYLGNGEHWHQIYDLNVGKPQPDGQALTDPGLIYPGWILLLPAAPPHANGTAPAPHPRHVRVPAHRPPSPSRPSPPPAGPSQSQAAPKPTPPQTSSAHAHPAPCTHHRAAIHLPSGAVIGLSLATAAGLAIAVARLHRRRRREPASIPGTAPAETPLTPALRRIRQAHLDAGRKEPPGEETGPAAGYLLAARADSDDIPPRHEPSTEAINVAVRNDEEIPLDLTRLPGIGLTGPGAADAIRAIIITLLARRTRDQAEVLLCGEETHHLVKAEEEPGPPQAPGLTLYRTAEDGLSRLETEIIHRRRLLDADGNDDLTAYRDANPDEHLPTILTIAPAASPHAKRLAAALTLGQQLGITGILAGSWPPPGATCEIAANGQVVTVSSDELRHLDDAQTFQLTPEESADVLATLAAASGSTGAGVETGSPRLLAPLPDEQPESGTQGRMVQIAVLGPFQLHADGQPITKGLRRKAAELLTYLTIHHDGATTDAILDALWQDIPVDRAAPILHAATSNVRKLLRAATGESEAGFILRAADHLRLDPLLVETDLWCFQESLVKAARSSGDRERRASLQAAADLWRGDLAPSINSAWIDEDRETLRRDAVDTLARLAELCEADNPEQALAHLERAITIDRYQEALYRRIMRLQGELGRPDAVRRTYQLLESRLTHIDAEPDENTADLLNKLVRQADAM
jgi:DNA-binding SARP family transcriptional activator